MKIMQRFLTNIHLIWSQPALSKSIFASILTLRFRPKVETYIAPTDV
jgi:hypothetical protein